MQAAAGVVADSDPQSEWQETQHKARAILKAAAQCTGEADAEIRPAEAA